MEWREEILPGQINDMFIENTKKLRGIKKSEDAPFKAII
jgi:hypothetical protein